MSAKRSKLLRRYSRLTVASMVRDERVPLNTAEAEMVKLYKALKANPKLYGLDEIKRELGEI